MGLFQNLFSSKEKKLKAEKYKIGMKKTRLGSFSSLKDILISSKKIDDVLYDRLEEIFIMSDISVTTTIRFLDRIRGIVKKESIVDPKALESIIVDGMFELYLQGQVVKSGLTLHDGLNVILFVGVNGTGKTTSIGKMAHMIQEKGKKVMLAAGDTFRAGAIDQLKVWGERNQVTVISKGAGSDPSSVVFDAIREAKKESVDVLLIDTAGRLQNKVNLMNELAKIKRTISKEIETSFETLLVVDATTGQNGLSQAKIFNEVTEVTGIVLTKLDGTAKGGIVLSIRDELKIPIRFVGLGEKITDLIEFDIEDYIYGLFADFFEGA